MDGSGERNASPEEARGSGIQFRISQKKKKTRVKYIHGSNTKKKNQDESRQKEKVDDKTLLDNRQSKSRAGRVST